MKSHVKKIMNAVVISTATTTYSDTFDMQSYKGAGVQLVPGGTGTLAGSAILQASNDGTNWASFGSSQNLSTTTPLNFNAPDFYFGMLRLAITSTSGTSTCTAIVDAKGA